MDQTLVVFDVPFYRPSMDGVSMPLDAFDLHVHPLGRVNEIFLVICYARRGSIIKHQGLGVGVEGTWRWQTRAVPSRGHSRQGCLRN